MRPKSGKKNKLSDKLCQDFIIFKLQLSVAIKEINKSFRYSPHRSLAISLSVGCRDRR